MNLNYQSSPEITQTSSDGNPALNRLREFLLGPTRFMNLLSCYELGLIEVLERAQDRGGMTANEIGKETGVSPHAVEQLFQLMVKEEFLAYDEARATYRLSALATVSAQESERVVTWLRMIKTVCLRQLYHLSDSVRLGRVVGLRELYGFDGNLYEAGERHSELKEAWGPVMAQVTRSVDPWFFRSIDIASGARVLDLAGNTGLGAILAHQYCGAGKLSVTCFDFPEKEAEALRNFREHGVQEHCSFIGGDVFEGVPRGFDVVMIKHFIDMFERENALEILRAVHQALEVGGQLILLMPIYAESNETNYTADFFPAYFLGCSMGQGGPQKLSTYQRWLEECGFEVTQKMAEDPQNLPPDSFIVHGILCATKV